MTCCFFCREGRKLHVVGNNLSRKVYDDDICYAVLEKEQSVKGYTLVILRRHVNRILDPDITDGELVHFWRLVQKIGKAIKDVWGAENVYVCSLCDGVAHFHVHLIPRYAWTDKDKDRYRKLFLERDGKKNVETATSRGSIGGFWYMADAEREYHKSDFMKLLPEERMIELDRRASLLRNALAVDEGTKT